eukprot:1452259-Pleurochrysis_carterae.AAC.1
MQMLTVYGPETLRRLGMSSFFSRERANIAGEDARKRAPRYLMLTANLRACRRCGSTITAFAACSTRDSKQ